MLACGGEPASTPITIALLTANQPAQACEDALLTGQLVPDTDTGLAVRAPNGEITKVEWPFGYSARYADDRIELLDADGNVVGAEGDNVQMGGGFGNRFWHACGAISRGNR